MQPRFVNGSFVKLARSPYATNSSSVFIDKKLTGIVVSVKETNTSSMGSASMCYPYVYYVFFSDCMVRGPLFSEELECL